MFRVIVQGEGLDLLGAFSGASMDDWRALIMDTGRGSSAVKAGVERLELIKAADDLTPDAELALMDTLTDLVFLAKRRNGGRMHWAEVSESVPYFELMAEFGQAAQRNAEAQAKAATPDPTTVPTDSDRDDANEPPTDPTR